MSDPAPVYVLLIEENPGDVELIREALDSVRPSVPILLAIDGEAALASLHLACADPSAPRPGLILLDLNLPRKDGFAVLEEIKSSPELRSLPVVILSSAASPADILKGYRLQADCFVSKPVEVDEFLRVLRATFEFWLDSARISCGREMPVHSHISQYVHAS